jgi:hypothetical protein
LAFGTRSYIYIYIEDPGYLRIQSKILLNKLVLLLPRNLKNIFRVTIMCWDFPFIRLPEDPAFSTGGRSIFKCKYLRIGSIYKETKTDFKNSTCLIFNLVLY